MSLSGTFETNFQSLFNDAAEAVRWIANMSSAADKSEISFADFFDQLGKGGLEKNPFELATTGINAFANALGPTGLLLGGFTVGAVAAGAAVYKLGDYAAEATNAIGDLSEKAGVSTEVATRYARAFEVAGGSADQFGHAMQTLEKGVAENSQTLEKGLGRIGLSIEDLKASNPGTWIETIADAFRDTKDPIERSAAAMEIFKGQGRELVPVLMNLNEGLKETSGLEPITAAQKEAAEEYARHWANLKVHASAWATALGNEVVPGINKVMSRIENTIGPLDRWAQRAADILDIAAHGGGAGVVDVGPMPDVPEKDAALKGYTNRLKEMQGFQRMLHDGITTTTDSLRLQKEEITRTNAEIKKITDEQKAWNDIMAELNSVGKDFHDTINQLDGSVVEAVKHYLDAGVSQSTLAKAYELTAAQVRAIKRDLDEYHAALKAVTDVEKKIADEGSAGFKALGTQSEITAGSIKKMADAMQGEADARKKINEMLTGTVESAASALDVYNRRMAELKKEEEEGLPVAEKRALAEAQYTKSLQEEAIAQDQATLAAAKNTDEQKKNTDAKQQAMTVFTAMQNLMFPSGESLRASTLEPGSMLGLGLPSLGPSGYSISGLTKPPVNITINGSVLSNKDEIARVVGDALVSAYRAGGNRTPV